MDRKIEQFVAVTGASVAEARSLLEACGGNLDLAVNMLMEGGGGGATPGPSGFTTATTAGPDPGPVVGKTYEEMHGVRAPIPPSSGVLIDQDPAPSTRRVLRSRRLPPTVFDPFQDYSKVASGVGGETSKMQSLAELFKAPFDIMFSGTFQELRMAGQSRKRWLLINLQDSKEFASQVLNRDVWSHEAVKTVISEHLLFWQIHRITDDGVRFKQLYHVENFPYVAIIDPRTGEKLAGWESITASKFISELSEFLQNNKFDDTNDDQSDGGGMTDMSEEQQLEAAIRASLQSTAPKTARRHDTADSDDFVSLSSDDEEGEGVSEMEQDGGTSESLVRTGLRCREVDSGSRHPLATSGTLSRANHTTSSSDGGTAHHLTGVGNNHDHLTNRKRKSAGDDFIDSCGPPLKKVLRSDATEIHLHVKTRAAGRNSGFPRATLPTTTDLTRSELRPEKGTVRSSRKGKQRIESASGAAAPVSSSAAVTVVSVEERLASGELQRVDVAQLVIRLPDGTRVQKAFLSSSPIEHLFVYLRGRGIDTEQHDIMTNFPRRVLQELEPSLTFRQANLYPSVTIFVQD